MSEPRRPRSTTLAPATSSVHRYADALDAALERYWPGDVGAGAVILHVGLDDTRALRTWLRATTTHAYVVVHDPPAVLGRDGYRPPKASLPYALWRFTSGRRRDTTRRTLLDRSEAVFTTSRVAAQRTGWRFSAHLGPVLQAPFAPAEEAFGFLGRICPERSTSDAVTLAQRLPSNHFELMGISREPVYLEALSREAPANLSIVANAPDPAALQHLARWRALIVLPQRAGSLSASQAVVDALCSGVPVLYPDGADVISEYAGPAGRAFGSVTSLGAALADEVWLRTARIQARARADQLSWAQHVQAWWGLLAGVQERVR